MDKWKIIDSKVLINTPWLTLKSDRCINQKGVEIPAYYWFEGGHYVVVVGVTADKKVVFVEQYRHGIKDVILEFPAGLIDENEDPIESAKRELLEETGYLTEDIVFERVVYPAAAISDKKCYLFFARNLVDTGKQHLEGTEFIDVKLYNFDELQNLVGSGTLKGAVGIAASLLAMQKREWFFEK